MTGAPRLREGDGVMVLDVPEGWVALSSASVGGGLVWPRWVANVTVDEAFARTDLEAYVEERLRPYGLVGPGPALLTAADVRGWTGGEADGVQAWATVAPTRPTWAARPGGRGVRDGGAGPRPGTVNIVVALPVPLTTAALVQAVGTVTEAKAQGLLEAGVPGTGTASDALVVLCPDSAAGGEAPVPFAGVRSPWGHRVAEAVRQAVVTGMQLRPWPQVAADPERLW